MRDRADVVIIGGGVQGLSSAYSLVERSVKDVVLLEKGYLGCGASRRCAAGIRAQFTTEENLILGRESIKIWERFSEEMGFNIFFIQSGYLFLASTQEELDFLKGTVKFQNSMDVKSKRFTPEMIVEMVPMLNMEGIVGASFCPTDGHFHHDPVIWAYAEAAKELGAEINTYTEVIGLRVDNGEIETVITNRGEIKTSVVINAAGPHSDDIAKMVGVDLPITPYRREALVTEHMKHFLDPVVISMASGVYCHQSLRGELICGIELEEEPSYKINSSLRFLETVSREILKIFPGFRHINVMRQWAGLYDITPDGSPILGEVDGLKGFIQLNGFSGHGFMLAPICGKLMAELIISGKTSIPIDTLNLRRFEEGKLIHEKMEY